MIRSWKTPVAKAIFEGRDPGKGFPQELVAVTRRKLARINDAGRVDDLRVPPGNRLHLLSGDRVGQWAISINDQWRICFSWREGDAHDVELVDYH
ncbi:MAG: type II toxin-antitoxin system RelE/ParE family toxin [Ancalomicrobiaceae bacterium]|nr:type II toxin-antitoxin system RelE/ParE family toxin [Ancalomicrobiaceae bacterium]